MTAAITALAPSAIAGIVQKSRMRLLRGENTSKLTGAANTRYPRRTSDKKPLWVSMGSMRFPAHERESTSLLAGGLASWNTPTDSAAKPSGMVTIVPNP